MAWRPGALIARGSVALAAFVGIAFLGSCESRTDSRGAANTAERSYEPVRWDTTFLIGGRAEDTLLQLPRLVAASRDRIAVFDYGDASVKSFDARGNLVWRFGRAGAGPGEFSGAFDISVDRNGRTWLLDPELNRLTVLTPVGKLDRVIHPRSDLIASLVVGTRDVIVLTGRADRFWLRIDPEGRILGEGPQPLDFVRTAPRFARQPIGAGASDSTWAAAFPYGDRFLVYDGGQVRCIGRTIEGGAFPTRPAPDLPFWLAGISIADGELVVLAQGLSEDRLRVLDLYSLKDCTYLRSVRLPRAVSAFAYLDDSTYVFEFDDPAPTLLGLRLGAVPRDGSPR